MGRTLRALLVGALFVLVGCSCSLAIRGAKPEWTTAQIEALYPTATRFEPTSMHYAAWQYVQECSRSLLPPNFSQIKFQALRWYVAQAPVYIRLGDGFYEARGIFFPPNIIVISSEYRYDAVVAAHELLHYSILNLRARRGRAHPKEYFHDRCKLLPADSPTLDP